MDHRFSFEAIDKAMNDVVGKKNTTGLLQLFSGKTILFRNDFKQVLLVKPKEKKAKCDVDNSQ